MTYLLGIDIGTSGTKAVLLDAEGRLAARATAEYPLHTPRPLWSEQDPEDWWTAVGVTIREILDRSGIAAKDIAGVGLSGQMHGAVFLGEGDRALRPAILWNDQRTQKECDWITETIGRQRVVELTLNSVLTGFTAGKIVWVRDHEPEVFARVRRVLLPKDYIRLRLTGEYATDVSDASGTALFDVARRRWSDEMLDGCGIPAAWMPPAFESPEITGRISATAAAATGLPIGIPVVGGGGDQAAGAVGNGIVEEGIVSSTVGTSGVVFAFADRPVLDPEVRLHTFCHAVPGAWHVMGVMLSAGGSLQWYRDTFCAEEKSQANARGIDPYEVMTAAAAEAPAGSEGLLFLPYLTGERTPHPDPYARGVFFGITRRSSKAHFTRSVLEGVAYGLRDTLEIMRELRLPMREVRLSGGGARSELWRSILTDVANIPHKTLAVDEGPALGAALLAGVGTGRYPDVPEACRAVVRVTGSTEVCSVNRVAYDRFYGIYRSLYPALRESFAEVGRTIA